MYVYGAAYTEPVILYLTPSYEKRTATMSRVERSIKYRLAIMLNINQSTSLDPWLMTYEADKLAKEYRRLDVEQCLASQEVSA